jgi:hypothetical protein
MTISYISAIDQFAEAVLKGASELPLEIATEVAEGVRQSMHESKGGVKYPDLPHTSSAPGESPATQSGDYESSIKVTQTSEYEAEASTDHPLALLLEFGGGRLLPRPNWTVQSELVRQRVEERGRAKLAEAVTKAAL